MGAFPEMERKVNEALDRAQARYQQHLNQQQFAQVQPQAQSPPKPKGPTHRCFLPGCPAEGLQKHKQSIFLHEEHVRPYVAQQQREDLMAFDMLHQYMHRSR